MTDIRDRHRHWYSLFTPDARRVLKMVALLCTPPGKEFLLSRGNVFSEWGDLDMPSPLARILPIVYFFPYCAARTALCDSPFSDDLDRAIAQDFQHETRLISLIESGRAVSNGLISDDECLSMLEWGDCWFLLGDAIDYAKLRSPAYSSRERQFFAQRGSVPGNEYEAFQSEYFSGQTSTLDVLLSFLNSGLYPGDGPPMTFLEQNSGENAVEGIRRLRNHTAKDAGGSSERTVLLEIRRGPDGYSVNLISPYGSFNQFAQPSTVSSVASRLYLPCRPPLFIEDEVRTFERIINDPSGREAHLQQFLEVNSHFIRALGYQGFRSQVHLIRQDIDGAPAKRANLRPDFLLRGIGLNASAVLEIKRASERMTVGPKDRRGFSAALSAALRQLDDYYDFFADSSNRRWFVEQYGTEVANPELVLLIGKEDQSELGLGGSLLSPLHHRPVRVLTYDQIVQYVRCQHLVLPDGRP